MFIWEKKMFMYVVVENNKVYIEGVMINSVFISIVKWKGKKNFYVLKKIEVKYI